MGATGFFHHFGSFLLLSACVLLIITDISAPVVNSISILKVNLDNTNGDDGLFNDNNGNPVISFGTFGYCVQNALGDDNDICTKSHIGYDPIDIITSNLQGVDFGSASGATARALTNVMVLHPVATGLAFISFLLALGAGFVGSLLASLGALLTFVVTLVVLITDFVGFAIVHHEVNDHASNSHAEWGAAAWTTLVSAICSLLAAIVLFLTCCSRRMHKKREARRMSVSKHGDGYAPPTDRRRGWF
ncbi:pali-domain-containing protein [Xylariomycetidae sp. FL0641]|nr:pali-domain-containing protein [Xylariomycetidae sp. FL0641]